MEYCPSGCLQDVIKASGRVSTQLLRVYARQLLEAIIYIHSKGITHNDIKPQNILIGKYGRLKFADFGNGLSWKNGDLIMRYHGTPITMAPEIVSRKPHDPFKTDIWSLGVTFYIMASGKHPWSGKSIESIQQSILNVELLTYPKRINKEFAAVIKKMLMPKPEMREKPINLLKMPFFKKETPKSEPIPLKPFRNKSQTLLIKSSTIHSHTKKPASIKFASLNSPTITTKNRGKFPVLPSLQLPKKIM